MKTYINGKENAKVYDNFNNPYKFINCKHMVSRKRFLLIKSKFHLFGIYDAWNSKEGDILEILDERGKVVYKFESGKYWVTKDYSDERDIINTFKDEHPDVFEVSYDFVLTANFLTHIDKYKVIRSEDGYEFALIQTYEVNDEPTINLDDTNTNTDDEVEHDAFSCDLKCPYNEKGSCIYFETEITHMDVSTTCDEPFVYLENKK